MSRGFQSEYLLYVKRRNEELKSVDTHQGKNAGVKPLNVSSNLAKVVREHGRLVIQRPGLDVSQNPEEKGRKAEKDLNVTKDRKKKPRFPAVYGEKRLVAKKRASVIVRGTRGNCEGKTGIARWETWSCEPGFQDPLPPQAKEPQPSTSKSEFSNFGSKSIGGKSLGPVQSYEIDDTSETESSTSLTTSDSEERIARTLEERVQATHIKSKPQDVPLTKSQQPVDVNMPSTNSTEKKVVGDLLLAKRPKRIIVPKSPEDATGLSWTEETQLKKALYASLRETSKQSDVTDGENAEAESPVATSLKLEDMVVKRGQKRKVESETSSVSSMATSSVASPTKEQPKYIKSDAFDLKKAQVRAQRKFAQGSQPNSPNITPVKLKSGVAPLPTVAPCKRAKTEDFLTFLCLRGTPALPAHLDFFNYPPEYSDEIASTASTPKHARMTSLKREVRSKSPQSSGSSTADRRDISDKTGELGFKPMKLGSPPKPLKRKRKQIGEQPNLTLAIPKRARKVITPQPMELKSVKKRAEVKVEADNDVNVNEEKKPRLRTLTQRVQRSRPKTRALFLAKNARQTLHQRINEVKVESDDDVKEEVPGIDLVAAKRQRARRAVKRTIKTLRHKSKSDQSRSLRSSTMVQRNSGSQAEEQAGSDVRETRSKAAHCPSVAPPPAQQIVGEVKRSSGRPKAPKPDANVSPKMTGRSPGEVKIPELIHSRRSRPIRRVERFHDDLFDFDDPIHEIPSPRQKRFNVRSQRSPAKPTRTRRQSYGSSIGTRSVSSESRRSTSRESSPEKRTRIGTRSSPRIKSQPGSVENEGHRRPVTRRSRASYSELSLDVSGFSDDPESHPRSPSVRSTASVRSTSSVSSLRYSIKSGELSPVGTRGKQDNSQAGKQASASSCSLAVTAAAAAAKVTPPVKHSHTSCSKQVTSDKQSSPPVEKYGTAPTGRQVDSPAATSGARPTRRHTLSPTRKQAPAPAGKQYVIHTRKQSVTSTRKQAWVSTEMEDVDGAFTAKAASVAEKQTAIATRKQSAITVKKHASVPCATQAVAANEKQGRVLPATGKETLRSAEQEVVYSSSKPSLSSVITYGKRPPAVSEQAVASSGKFATSLQKEKSGGESEGVVISPTRRPAALQCTSSAGKQVVTPKGKQSAPPVANKTGIFAVKSPDVPRVQTVFSATTKLSSSQSGEIVNTRTGKLTSTSEPGKSFGKQYANTMEKSGVASVTKPTEASGTGAPALVMKKTSPVNTMAQTGQTVASPARPATNASRMITATNKFTPSHSKVTSPTARNSVKVATAKGSPLNLPSKCSGSPTTDSKTSTVSVSPKGATPTLSPRANIITTSQTVATASASPKPVTTRVSPVTIAPRTLPVAIVPKGSPIRAAPKTPPFAVQKGPSRGTVSQTLRTSVTTSKNSTSPTTDKNSVYLVSGNKPSTVYVPGRSTNIGARIAANPKLNFRTSTGTSSMAKVIPVHGRIGTIVKPSAAGIKIPASPDKTSGVNMLLKFASSSARPSSSVASASAAGRAASASAAGRVSASGAVTTTRPAAFGTDSAKTQTKFVPSPTSSKTVVEGKVIASNGQGRKEKAQLSKAAELNKATVGVSIQSKTVLENTPPKAAVIVPGSESSSSKTSSSSSSPCDLVPSEKTSPCRPATPAVGPSNTASECTVVKPVVCTADADPNVQGSPLRPKAVVRTSIEIIKASSPSPTQDVQQSLISSISENTNNTSRPVTPIGGQSPVSVHKNWHPPKRKRKGPKTIRDLLEARRASLYPRDEADGDTNSAPVLVTPNIPPMGIGAPPAMVNVMVQGNTVQSMGLPCSMPHVQPVQMVSEGVQTCDEDREEGANLPQLTCRKRNLEEDGQCHTGQGQSGQGHTGQGRTGEKKVKEKVRKGKDRMLKIKDIEPSITYVTEAGLPAKEPELEKAKRSNPSIQVVENKEATEGTSPAVEVESGPQTSTPDVSQPQVQRGRKKTIGRKRGRQSYTIGKSIRTSPATVEDILEATRNESVSPQVTFPPTDGSACIIDTPVFAPTEQEFQDPLAYIAKIRPDAEKYGMCCIQPPPSWKPDCKVHDEMRFTSQIQYIHLTHHRWGPNREKMECIKKHLQSQSVDLEQLPLIGGIELDLPRLGATIQEFGGLQHVLDKKKWNKVADVMGISKLALDRTTKLYDAYCKYLLSYDTLSKEDKEKIRKQVLEEKNNEELEKEKACVIKGRSNSLCGFYRAARNTMAMWFNMFKDDPTSEQAENEYWRVVESGRHHVAVQCGQVDTRITGSGFPNRKENPYSRHSWNLNILANNNGSLLRHLGPIAGVTVPTLYVRMLFTSSCWSRDLHQMPYIAYMHSGSDLIWYAAPKSEHSKFRDVMTEMFPDRVDDTHVWLKRDMIMVPPKQLVNQGVSLTRTVQKQRQFVVVFPEVYTANISCGYNISEQVNFAHPDYLPLGYNAAKMLNESCVSEVFPFEKMLCSLAKNEKIPTEMLSLVVPILEEIVEEELHYRHQLQAAGLKRSDRMCVIDEPVQTSWKKRRTIDPSEEEDNTCEISKKICYVSMVVNEADDVVYSLPHAMPHIQKKKSLKSCKLLYRYTEDELKQMLHNAKERLANPPEFVGKKRKSKATPPTSEPEPPLEGTSNE